MVGLPFGWGGCALFAAVSGSSPATVVAIGSILMPATVKWDSQMFGVGVITTSGLWHPDPPSIVMVIPASHQHIGRCAVHGLWVVPILLPDWSDHDMGTEPKIRLSALTCGESAQRMKAAERPSGVC